MTSLDTNARTAPTALWNAHHELRKYPAAHAEAKRQGVTCEKLRNWALLSKPEQDAIAFAIHTALNPISAAA